MRYAYFGHHKCASTWIDTIIKEVVKEHGYEYRGFVDHKTPQAEGPLTDYSGTVRREDLAAYVAAEGIDVVSCLAADNAQVEALQPLRGVHVIRDPRDIIVSGYFSHKHSHPVGHLPHMAAHRQQLQEVSKDEGLLLEMDYAASALQDMAEWDYENPDILELKMEDLTAEPYAGFLQIFSHFGLLDEEGGYSLSHRLKVFIQVLANRLSLKRRMPLDVRRAVPVSAALLLDRVYDNRFEKKAKGRDKGESDVKSHYRKGKAGDWRNHFTERHVSAFEEMFGDIVWRLGYAEGASASD
jgi:hypothetical protein